MSENKQKQYAIYVKNAKKSYRSKTVLNHFTMKVPRGCMYVLSSYGLLGASGCGKTTLLKCLVNLKQFESGDVYVLGGKPGTPESGVPGPAIGYMPQEIALVAEFTVRDAVYYFGRIYNMNDWLIEERLETLKVLLDLPPSNRQLKNCSGGQQRRVSLAAAMVHKPQLLILDEPTVGLDPVLRDKIWNHLINIAENEQTTIIITTHYIEEARHAHKIGLMREGKLLAEESPERLMQLFNTETLEEVFLILSAQQERRRFNNPRQELGNSSKTDLLVEAKTDDLLTSAPIDMMPHTNNSNAFRLNKHHLKALMFKNTKQFLQNFGGMAFLLSFPILQMWAFLAAVGKVPLGLKLAIVNEDACFGRCANYTNVTAVPDVIGNCHFANVGCRLLNEIDSPMLDMKYYQNLHDALKDVQHGEVVGVLHVLQNFSDAFSDRINRGNKVHREKVGFSEVKAWLDSSDYPIRELLKHRLFRLVQDFQMSAFEECNLRNKLGSVPIRFTFEYRSENEGEEYADFALPGMLSSIVFFLGATLTMAIIVTERQEGVWDRSIIAGVNSLEIVITHFVMQFLLVLIQTCELIILVFVIYEHNYVGDMFLIFVFTLFQGLEGMVFGFCISVITDNLIAATVLCNGLLLPLLLSTGFLWPLEGQHRSLRSISKYFPTTRPILSLRQVIIKGFGVDEWQVWDGLGASIIWILIPSLISVFVIKWKQ